MEVFWMLWYLSWATQGNARNLEALLLIAEKSCTTSLRYTCSFFPLLPNVNTSFGTGLRSDHSWIACHQCATRFLFEITGFLETSPNFFSRLSCRITVAQQYSPGIQSSLRSHSWPKGIFFFNLWTPWQTNNDFFLESWDWDFPLFCWCRCCCCCCCGDFCAFFFGGGSPSKALSGDPRTCPLTTSPGKSLHLHCLILPVRWSISRSHQAKKQNTQSFLGTLHQKVNSTKGVNKVGVKIWKIFHKNTLNIPKIPTNRCLTFNSWVTSYSFTIQFLELIELKLELENQRTVGS